MLATCSMWVIYFVQSIVLYVIWWTVIPKYLQSMILASAKLCLVGT